MNITKVKLGLKQFIIHWEPITKCLVQGDHGGQRLGFVDFAVLMPARFCLVSCKSSRIGMVYDQIKVNKILSDLMGHSAVTVRHSHPVIYPQPHQTLRRTSELQKLSSHQGSSKHRKRGKIWTLAWSGDAEALEDRAPAELCRLLNRRERFRTTIRSSNDSVYMVVFGTFSRDRQLLLNPDCVK